MLPARYPHIVTLALPTMTLHSTNDSSIFYDGKLKPGIYKIQNIKTETYLDIEVDTREVCCRPAKDLGEGRGLVSQYPPSVAHASDNFGSGKSNRLGLDIVYRG